MPGQGCSYVQGLVEGGLVALGGSVARHKGLKTGNMRHIYCSMFAIWLPQGLGHSFRRLNHSRGTAADVVVYNSVISACGKSTEWQRSLQYLAELAQLSLQVGHQWKEVPSGALKYLQLPE